MEYLANCDKAFFMALAYTKPSTEATDHAAYFKEVEANAAEFEKLYKEQSHNAKARVGSKSALGL